MHLQDGETVLMELRPEKDVLKVWVFTKCIPAVFMGVFLSFWAFSFFGGMMGNPSAMGMGIVIAGPGAIIIFIGTLVYISYLRKTFVYHVTDRRCNFEGGIFRYADRSVTYDRITNVEKSQNLLERIIGIESIWVQTAGTGLKKPEIVFAGLMDADAPLSAINRMKQESLQRDT